MKTIAYTLGVSRSNLAERVRGNTKPRRTQKQPWKRLENG